MEEVQGLREVAAAGEELGVGQRWLPRLREQMAAVGGAVWMKQRRVGPDPKAVAKDKGPPREVAKGKKKRGRRMTKATWEGGCG